MEFNLDKWKPTEEEITTIKAALLEHTRYQQDIGYIEGAEENKTMLKKLYNTKDPKKIKKVCQEYCLSYIELFEIRDADMSDIEEIYGYEFTNFISKVLGIGEEE